MYYFKFIKLLIADLQYYLSVKKGIAQIASANPTCKFYSGVKISGSSFDQCCVIFQNVLMINSQIGAHSYIQKNSTIIHATIGKFCSIAANVTIGPGIHYMDGISTHPSFYLRNTPLLRTFVTEDKMVPGKATKIGHDVWIGQSAIIMDGVIIGTGAVIASGAIVTKDVPAFAIVGGIPAKIIRFRFAEDVRNALLESEWWNMDEKWLEENATLFLEPEKFLSKVTSTNS